MTTENILKHLGPEQKRRYIEAPEIGYFGSSLYEEGNVVFLAGGITGVGDWQGPAARRLLVENKNVCVYNPRRESFDLADPTQSEIQITWEYNRLANSRKVLFWFPKGSLCPITLFEYGRELTQFMENHSMKTVYVGCDPEYPRVFDVKFQTKLITRNVVRVHDSLDAVIDEVLTELSR